MANMPDVAKSKTRTGLTGNCEEGHERGSAEERYDGYKTLPERESFNLMDRKGACLWTGEQAFYRWVSGNERAEVYCHGLQWIIQGDPAITIGCRITQWM